MNNYNPIEDPSLSEWSTEFKLQMFVTPEFILENKKFEVKKVFFNGEPLTLWENEFEKVHFFTKSDSYCELFVETKESFVFILDMGKHFNFKNIIIKDCNKTIGEILFNSKSSFIFLPNKKGKIIQAENGTISIEGWSEIEFIDITEQLSAEYLKYKKKKYQRKL